MFQFWHFPPIFVLKLIILISERVERTTGEILWVTLIDANLLESTVAESVKLSFIRWSFFNSTGGQQPRRLLEAAEEDGRIFHLYLTLFKRMMAGGQRRRREKGRRTHGV